MPDTACLTKITLPFAILFDSLGYANRICLSCPAKLFSFLHTIQSDGQCTNAFPAALISRINSSHSKLCFHTSLSCRSYFSLLCDHAVSMRQKTRGSPRLGSPKGGHHPSVHHQGVRIRRSNEDHAGSTPFQSNVCSRRKLICFVHTKNPLEERNSTKRISPNGI